MVERSSSPRLENKATSDRRRLSWIILAILMVVSIGLEFVFYRKSHFGEHGIDATLSFFAWLAFFGPLLIVLASRIIGHVLEVKDDDSDA